MKVIKKICIYLVIMGLFSINVLPASAAETKKLYFVEKDGKMTWDPVRGSDGNWFMSFINMVPGGHYTDQLDIENGSRKTYELYMQVIPLEQSKELDELLELISMKVSLDSKVLYEGTASGKDYHKGAIQDVILLGTYKPGDESKITVELELDKNVGIEYCDLLTKNDWKFMVTEVGGDKEHHIDPPPKTGDESPVEKWLMIFVISCSIGALAIVALRKEQKKNR